MKKEKTTLQKVMKKLLSWSIIFAVFHYIKNPEKINIPLLDIIFGWFNKVFVPTGFETDSFVQKAVGSVTDWLFSVEIIGFLIKAAFIVIPAVTVIYYLIVSPIIRIKVMIENKKIEKEHFSKKDAHFTGGSLSIMNFGEKLLCRAGLKKLQEETVYAFVPEDESYIRVQTVYPANQLADVVLTWDKNQTADYGKMKDGEFEIHCFMREGQAQVVVRGEEEFSLPQNQPFGINEDDADRSLKYVVTWIV